MILMRILIYGAGVIGSLYAALFAEAGYDTNIYARGKRLEVLRNNGLQWLMNTLEMPLANICGHGDVQVPTRDVVIKCCKKVGLKVEKFEIRKGMRMHCVVRKPMGKAIGNER